MQKDTEAGNEGASAEGPKVPTICSNGALTGAAAFRSEVWAYLSRQTSEYTARSRSWNFWVLRQLCFEYLRNVILLF